VADVPPASHVPLRFWRRRRYSARNPTNLIQNAGFRRLIRSDSSDRCTVRGRDLSQAPARSRTARARHTFELVADSHAPKAGPTSAAATVRNDKDRILAITSNCLTSIRILGFSSDCVRSSGLAQGLASCDCYIGCSQLPTQDRSFVRLWNRSSVPTGTRPARAGGGRARIAAGNRRQPAYSVVAATVSCTHAEASVRLTTSAATTGKPLPLLDLSALPGGAGWLPQAAPSHQGNGPPDRHP
jgi:hypothetical protein